MEQSQIERIYILMRRKLLTIISFTMLAISSVTFGYKASEHSDITTKAISNYKNWILQDTDWRVGEVAIDFYQSQIVSGSVDEDASTPSDPAPWLQHYMDPVTGSGLGGNASAYDRATDEDHWPQVLISYQNGDYEDAYWRLGRVIHLVEDMGVPAHVQLDAHAVSEWYEMDYIPYHHLTETDNSNLNSVDTLHSIMYDLATISDQFDSNGDGTIVTGTTTMVWAADGFTNEEGLIIASECYTGAIKAAGDALLMFYYEIKPTVQLLSPSPDEIHSGLIGVPLVAQAKSYNKQYTDADFINSVEFNYLVHIAPGFGDWSFAGNGSYDSFWQVYSYLWMNSIDDDVVTVCAIAIDDGKCDSFPDLALIKIDSTRPTVTNTKP